MECVQKNSNARASSSFLKRLRGDRDGAGRIVNKPLLSLAPDLLLRVDGEASRRGNLNGWSQYPSHFRPELVHLWPVNRELLIRL
jgi:hypothetical protein